MRRLACLAFVLGLVSPVAAQRLPGGQPAKGWEFAATLGGGWDGNPEYVTDTTGTNEGEFASFVSGTLAYNRRSPRGQFRLSLNGRGAYYPDQKGLNRGDGFVSLSGSRQLSPKVTFNLAGSYTYSHTDSLPVLIQGGLAYPLNRTQSFGGNMGLSWQFTPRGNLDVNFNYNEVDFLTGELVDTRWGNGSLSLSRRLGKRSSLSLNYSYQRTEQSDGFFDTQYATVGWSQNLSRALVLNLSAGPSYFVPPDIPRQSHWFVYGSLGLVGTWHRATLNALYTRSLTPAYGLGVDTLSDLFSLSASVPFSRRVTLTVASNYALAHNPQGLEYLYTTNDFSIDIAWQLARRLDLVVGSRLRRRQVTGAPDVWAPRGAIALAYGWSRL